MKSRKEAVTRHMQEPEALASGEAPFTLPSGPRHEEIEQRAYQIHLERGGIHGQDLEDWLQAEEELKAKYRAS